MEKFLRQNKKVVTPALLFVVLVVVTSFGGLYTFRRLMDTRAKVKSAQVERNSLNQRLETLKQAQTSSVSDLAKKATTALPANNSSLFVITQLRSLAQELVLIMDTVTLDARTVPGQELAVIDVSFRLEGEYEKVSEFITSLSEVTPIISVESVKILKDNNSENVVSGTINVKSYWAPFPDELPSITESVPTLTENESDIISRISNFKSPSLEERQPLTPSGEVREDPFNLNLF